MLDVEEYAYKLDISASGLQLDVGIEGENLKQIKITSLYEYFIFFKIRYFLLKFRSVLEPLKLEYLFRSILFSF